MIGTAMQALAARHRQWRRARNLRAGARSRSAAPAMPSLAVGGLLAMLGGAAVIATHARQLGNAVPDAAPGLPSSVDALQGAIPGAAFVVPSTSSVTLAAHGDAVIVVAAGMRAAAPVHIDLCAQMLEGSRPRLLPIRIGYQFADVARLLAASPAAGLRNVALVADASAAMPPVQVSGMAAADFDTALKVTWNGTQARWAGDAGAGAFRRDGWLVWKDAALRLHRRASRACPGAGELVIQLYRKGDADAGRALVMAFPAHGGALSASLSAGSYTVPQTPRASLEDQALFQDLQAHGLVRLGKGGLVELAPRDLAAWQDAPDGARGGQLQSWAAVARDPATHTLFKRLYRMADGHYVREQVRIFNNERRLLAWRVRPAQAQLAWQASVGAAPLATTGELPLAAARLFAEVPHGWAPWTRVAAWPDADPGAPVRIAMALPRAAMGGERIELMLVGRVLAVDGARLLGPPREACSGRACPSGAAVQLVQLEALPGARRIALDAAALDMGALAGVGEERYRHLRVAGTRLEWRALANNSSAARAPALAGVTLLDRRGAVVWSGGAPTVAAAEAGLAPMLGLRADHANSVAGMLARIPSPGGEPHSARLTLDLALQKASHAALDCIGMRRGRWDGAHCSGGQPAPAGRQAGIVIVDADNGDILAAAGAGTGQVDAANWNEVRDFDKANPARSPLRLPALQHDGGAHRSPGSTFKIVSALGLELAAQRDPQLESLLAGMPLAAINRMAHRKGFAFRTDAASYPFGTQLAHITNYKDQHLDRRARDGRLGLSEALTFSLNTWFAWSGELSDRSLFGRAEGGAPDLQALEAGALDSVRPIAAMAHRLGFGQELRLDGGLLPGGFNWSRWDALQASEAHIDPIHTRHELRQMAIGLRMQVTPLHMALVAGAVGQGRAVVPRLLLELDGDAASAPAGARLGVRLDRIREGMKGVVDAGTAAGAFRGDHMKALRRGLSGKTGTSPAIVTGADGVRRELATVWFTGWLEPETISGQKHRLAIAAFVSHSEASGGEHAAPIVAAVLSSIASKP
ncbi:MAG: penicillin-binding transpeptidase domain-containing protein [Pseudomonadota bacterium]